MMTLVESLVAFCREDNRVCPLPPLSGIDSGRCCPTARGLVLAGSRHPWLILAAWHDTSAMLKMLRLAEHIEWAAQHGALESVARFLRELREEDWPHIGE